MAQPMTVNFPIASKIPYIDFALYRLMSLAADISIMYSETWAEYSEGA